jgi:hypothetical protein
MSTSKDHNGQQFKNGHWYWQEYTDSHAYILEARPNGKVKALIHSDYTGRATIGYIQNWCPKPTHVLTEDVPKKVVKKVQAKAFKGIG